MNKKDSTKKEPETQNSKSGIKRTITYKGD